MAKPYSVSPVKRDGKSFYVATFRTASGQRVNRSLSTANKKRAWDICGDLVRLRVEGFSRLADVPADFNVLSKALELYFMQSRVRRDEMPGPVGERSEDLAAVRAQADTFPESCRAEALLILLDRHRLQGENKRQRDKISMLAGELKDEKRALADLQGSMLGRTVAASSRVPDLPSALVLFARHMRANTTRANAREVRRVAFKFARWLKATGRERRSMAQVTPDDVKQFLDDVVLEGRSENILARRRAIRLRLGRFVNWSAQSWEYPSPMLVVKGVSKTRLDRDRPEIHWHTVDEVEQVIESQAQAYYGTLVATLAYAGLQLAELVWLRITDLEFEKGKRRAKLWITSVEDPSEPEVRHALKTGHRRRRVDVHPKYLVPRLKAHLAAIRKGTWLFPMPEDVRRRRRGTDRGDPDRWMVQTLSVMLRGHEGGLRRKPTAGLLPSGMNAMSLRRTFGSLLIRSGKSASQVAAAMGNTEEVVREHYARILSCEVDVDF